MQDSERVTDSSSRKATQAISKLFDDEIVSVTRSRRASCLGSHTALTMFNLEPLDFQIVALSASQAILAEPRILKSLGYKC